MAKLPSPTGRELIAAFQKIGFEVIRQKMRIAKTGVEQAIATDEANRNDLDRSATPAFGY